MACAFIIGAGGNAFAGHLRGVTLSWFPTSTPGEVEFRFQYSGRWSASGTPPLGTVHGETLNFGDGSAAIASGPITSINPEEDWFVADLKVRHTYVGAGPYAAFYSNASRISGLRNAASTLRLETIVRPASGNSSPASSSPPPIISVNAGPQSGFLVSATDVNSDTLRFRLSTAAESGIAAPPAGLAIDATTGQVTWNTSTLAAGWLYAVQFTVEDLDGAGNVKSKIPIDLTLRIAKSVGAVPTIAISPPGSYSVRPGTPINFTAIGNDSDPGDKVTLGSGNLPAGATMTPAVGPALTPPAASTFQWTPAAGQSGSYTLTFTATDATLKRASATVSIVVADNQAPAIACPQPVTTPNAVPAPVSVTVQDTDGDALTVVWKIDGVTTRTDNVLATQNPTALTLTQTYGTVGAHAVFVTAADPKNASTSCSTTVNVTKADQTISFAAIPDHAFGDAPFTVSAMASSNLPVTFDIVSGPAALTSGNLVTLFGPGLVTVRASQPGDSNYNAAPEADRAFTVNKAASSVTLTSSANPSFYRQDVTLTAAAIGPLNTAVPGGTITFYDGGEAISTPLVLDGKGRTALSVGDLAIRDHPITAVYSGDGLFNTSASPVLVQSVPNRPPQVSLTSSLAIDEGADAVTVTATANDEDSDPITFTWMLASGTGQLVPAGNSASYVNANGPATTVVRVTATDSHGGSASAETTITVNNVAPVVDGGNDTTTNEGAMFDRIGSLADPGADTWTATIDYGDGGGTQPLALNGDKTFTLAHIYVQDGRYTVTVTVGDADGGVGSAAFVVTVNNVAPSVGSLAVSATTIDENGTIAVSGAFSDPGLLDVHTLSIDWGDGTGAPTLTFVQTAPGVDSFTASHQYLDDAPTQTPSDVYQVIVTVSDDHDTRTVAAQVRVNNVAPTISNVTGPTGPVLVGSAADVRLTYTDPGPLDTFTCRYAWNDGSADTTATGMSGACSASHTYTAPGVYSVSIVLTDDDTGAASRELQYIVVYSPDAGSVTGGGWITSPSGALAANPTLTGRADFGFTAKYQGGVPVGQTEFHFQNGKANFRSTSYLWLVVSGSTARYKGSGTINGAGDYGFLATGVDGKLAGTNVDRIRIKIWDASSGAVVYDDHPGAADNAGATTPLSGGSVRIHK